MLSEANIRDVKKTVHVVYTVNIFQEAWRAIHRPAKPILESIPSLLKSLQIRA
jgi:hypothetical protein